MIRNTLPNKSGDRETLKKIITTVQNLSFNLHIVSEDLVRAFYKLLYLRFCDSNGQCKNTV